MLLFYYLDDRRDYLTQQKKKKEQNGIRLAQNCIYLSDDFRIVALMQHFWNALANIFIINP